MPPNSEAPTLTDDLPNHSFALNVSIVSTTSIKPASPTPPHYIPLSNLDKLVLPVYSTPILLYRGCGNCKNGGREERLAGLKRSLARVLVAFYPMAGRLVRLGNDDGEPCIRCNDEGVIWKEAIADAPLTAVEDYYPEEHLLGLPVEEAGPGPFYPARPGNANGVPVLAVQATWFECGGLALSVAWHHSVADGSSGWNFLRSWAEVNRGESISIMPNHDRSLLRARCPPALSAPLTSYIVGRAQAPSSGSPSKNNSDVYKTKSCTGQLPLGSTSGMVLHKIYFSKETIDSLKNEALRYVTAARQSNGNGGNTNTAPGFSSAVSVAAHLWRVLTRSRELPDDQQLTHFSLTVDMRRSQISVPPGYFGNALMWASAEGAVGDVLNMPLGYAASLIHESIRGTRLAECCQSLIDAVEVHGPEGIHVNHHSFLGVDVAATFWTQMHLYDLDFGWGRGTSSSADNREACACGRPVYAGRNVIPRQALNGFVAVQPSPREGDQPGSMLALLYVDAKLRDRLVLHYPEFRVTGL